MKRFFNRFFPICLLLGLSLFRGELVHANVTETPHEIHFTADLDGDGRLDLVVIDRASGGFRAGYQLVPGVWTWSPARSTGINKITGATVGRWFSTGRDGFAVVSPMANRTHIVHAPVPGVLPVINPVFGEGIGPDQVAAPSINNNVGLTDLWLSTVENGAPDPVRITTSKHDGTVFSPLTNFPSPRKPVQVRTLPLKEGGISFVNTLRFLEGTNDIFNAVSYASGNAVVVIDEEVPAGSSWTSGLLGAGPLHHVLTWRAEETVFHSRAVVENPPITSFAPGVAHELGIAIGQINIVVSDDGPRVVVISADGQSATIFEFDGVDTFSFVQEFNAAPGDVITGLLPISSDGFHLLSGRSGINMTETVVPHSSLGGLFIPGAPTYLPALRPAALRANVFAFGSEPFVDPAALLLAQYNAPEWTSSPSLQNSQLTVLSEVFGSSAAGLGSKSPVSVGSVPMGTAFSLTNQYTGAISVHSMDTGRGPVGASVDILPIPGIKTKGFYLRFAPVPHNAPVHFRINNGSWTEWVGQSVYIYTNSSISFFARDPGSQQVSALRTIQYTFEQAPHEIDSDGDGIPDFVELAFGIDPLGGVDSDGDSFSDLNELLAGTDPNDPNSRPLKEGDVENQPSLNERMEENIAFRMRVAPEPIDGTTALRSMAESGVRLELYGLDGSSLGGAAAGPLSQAMVIGLRMDKVVADRGQGFVAVMTEPVFAIATNDADKDRGREIAGLFPIPPAALPEIDYTPGGEGLMDEALAWIAAAKLARDDVERPVVHGTWTEIDTLAAFLLEKKLEMIFLDRGLPGLAPGKMTLFGGRRGDAGRFAPGANDFGRLRDRLSDSLPGYLIEDLFGEISAAAIDGAAYADLRSVATAIYKVSSLSANGADPGTYLPPFDVLRALVRGASLEEPYLSETGIAPATLAAAQASVVSLLSGLSPRPVETFTLVVEEDSFNGGCHRLTEVDTDIGVNLFAAPGLPYASTDGFTLLPGTRLSVTGHPDLDEEGCLGIDLEVLHVTVISFPATPSIDADQNLLPDAWEWVFLLGGGNPFDDDDGDGFSNLQEFLDGTDPLDPQSIGMEIVDLSPPQVEIIMNEFGDVGLWWVYPPGYDKMIAWIPESSMDLSLWTPLPHVVVELAPGFFALQIEAPEENFFRVRMELKQ